MSEEEFSNENLAKTKDDEELYPVLVAEDGEVLDGKHRVEAKPNWHKKTVKAETRLEKIAVRARAHYRRRIPQSETQALILEAAKELEKLSVPKEKVASEIVERRIFLYNENYIRQLLPLEYKQPKKVEAAKLGAQLTEQKKQLSSKPSPVNHETFVRENGLVECEIGKHLVDPARTTTIEGHIVCNMHRETGKNRFTPKQETKPETKEYKPTETWEQRLAVRSPEHSEMQDWITQKLIEAEVKPVITDRWICLEGTKPDQDLPSLNAYVFLDGEEVHKGRGDRDSYLRGQLEKHTDKRVVSVTFKGKSDKEKQRVWSEVCSKLGITVKTEKEA